jgi:pantetheine-phosphate adenylyltransferase
VLTHLRDGAQAGRMFGDAYFAEQYNDKAIENLTREIDALSGA